MTEKQMMDRIMAGDTFVVGTYLNGRIDTINIRDKTNGNFRKGYIRRETIITGSDAVVVGGFLGDSEKPDEVKFPIKKGATVCAAVTKLESIQGFKLYGGIVEELKN